LGYICPQDFSINLLQHPSYYAINIATADYKKTVQEKILTHCNWLSQYANTEKIQKEYMSVINFMFAEDNTHKLKEFWAETNKLDAIRKENILEVIPELQALK
jgi:hypothetical protein